MGRFENIPPILFPGEDRVSWEARRETIVSTIAQIEYGCRPEMDYAVTWKNRSQTEVLEGKAYRLITDITVATALSHHTFPLYTFLPKASEKVPATVLICSQSRVLAPQKMPDGFRMEDLPGIFAQMNIVMDGPMDMGSPRQALDLETDLYSGHCPISMLVERGHAVSGFYAVDAQSDDGSFAEGLAAVFGTAKDRRKHEWGVLAIWSFAAGCVMDFLQTLPEIDHGRIGVVGHSRCGKAALWAAVTDPRFSWVMPNNSGCCGAALLRGKHGENMASINLMMGHWFAPAFREFIGREQDLPFDQHTVLALVAPRILHVASGSTDFWADPPGEHRSTVLAGEVYRLYGSPKLDDRFPDVNAPVTAGPIGYHLRQGPHLLTEYDWSCLLDHIHECSM